MSTIGAGARTTEERLADTFQPLFGFAFSVLFGPMVGRLFAYVFGERPTQSMVKFWGLKSSFETESLLGFLSPTYRRWVRNNAKISLRLQFEENALPQLLKKMFYETWEGWRGVLKEVEPQFPPARDLDKQLEARLAAKDFSGIQKYSEIEAQAEEKAKETISNPREWAEVFPPVPPVVDLRLRRKLLGEVNGHEGYTWEVATTVAEIQTNRRSLAGELTHRQASSLLSYLTNLSLNELKRAEPSQTPYMLSDVAVGLLNLLMDEQKAREFIGRFIGMVLIKRFLKYPYSESKTVSLDRPVCDDLTLGDTIPCNRTAEESSLLEDSIFLRQYLSEFLPPAEWEASDLFLRADERGITPKQLCEEENKNYETIQRNFERALRRLESQRTKP